MTPDNAANRERIRKALSADGRCVVCPPHQGENESPRNDHRYTDGVRVNRKPKTAK